MSWQFCETSTSLSHLGGQPSTTLHKCPTPFLSNNISKMATQISNTANMLPRFLLPRLSWRPAAAARNGTRVLSSLATGNSCPQTSRRAELPSYQKSMLSSSRSAIGSSRIVQRASQRRAFHATPRQSRDHHFDTLKFVQRLRDEGFTETQSVAMMKVLSDVIEERFILQEFLQTSF